MMRKLLLACAASLAFAATNAHANTISDNTGDWAIGYPGSEADLDVTSFSASYNPTLNSFVLQATLAGAIDPSQSGFYVIGADTGAGAQKPFAMQGAPNVAFDQVIIVQKTGATAITGHPALTATVNGNWFDLIVPLADLPSTGFTDPAQYAFNLWPRTGAGVITDFAPNNSDLTAVPEPGVWMLMIAGVGMIGASLRRRRKMQPTLA